MRKALERIIRRVLGFIFARGKYNKDNTYTYEVNYCKDDVRITRELYEKYSEAD